MSAAPGTGFSSQTILHSPRHSEEKNANFRDFPSRVHRPHSQRLSVPLQPKNAVPLLAKVCQSRCSVPLAPLHNVLVPFFPRQPQEPDAKVRRKISPRQGTSGSLAHSENHWAEKPLWCHFGLCNEVVCELAVKSCSSRHLLSSGLLNVEDVLLCLKDRVSWKLLSLSKPSLFLS